MKHEWIDELITVFKENRNRYTAHEKCKPILEKMSRSQEFLYDIIRHNLSDNSFLKRTRHYSTLTMTIIESVDFSFIVNIFPPLPDKRTDISFQSIHHHGSLLLSSVGAFGPGYNSILFKKGFSIDYATGITKMEIEKDYQNQLYQVGFVDAHQPHIVFYPAAFSATYALWCNQSKSTKDVMKKIMIIKKFKKPLVKIANAFRIGKKLGVNKIEFFDFYPEGQKIMAMKEREAYNEEGSNDNFLQNVFCFIQQTGFNDQAFLHDFIQKDTVSATAKKYAQALMHGDLIPDLFFAGHLNIPRVNLHKEDILKTFM